MQIKVCGITQLDQANALDLLPVNYIGFIFYPPSKRYVLNHLSLEALANFHPIHAKKIGVFVNESLDQLKHIVQEAKLDMVQLHGDESEAYCAQVRTFIPVIKVFRVAEICPSFEPFKKVADYFLLDTESALYGGTGNHFNWDIIKNTTIPLPYFLSGGIGPNDLQGIQVLKNTTAGKSLLALDLNSQFEIEPGKKNIEKIKTFIYACI